MKKYFSISGLFFLGLTISFGVVACGGDDEPDFVVNPSSVSMHYDGQQQLTAEGAVSWATDDEFVAKVDQTGLVKGGHVGSTKIVVSNGKRTAYCNVEVTPKYKLFDNPILLWGSSRSSIQSAENHPTLGNLTDDKFLAYDYSFGSSACIMLYAFNNGQLSSVLSLLNKSMYTNAGYYLLERYQPVATGSGTDFYFIDAMNFEKAKTFCVLDYRKLDSSTLTCIMFGDISTLNSSSAPTRGTSIIQEIPEEIMEVINNLFVE